MLIIIAGLPGTGKTTIAKALAALTGATHLNSDVIRSQLGLMGQYTAEAKQHVYDGLLERAGAALAAGKTVIVDSTFYQKSIREPFEKLANDCGVAVIWVEIQASERTLEDRLRKPRPDSEADFAVYEKIRDQFEPLPEERLILNSEMETPESAAKRIQQYVT
ncbi:MAG TPA: AAA family ATPase [Saprospiraceae bacterium]|nr:AAA family ATPase [Saprospiraceae bacterium]